MTWDLVNMESSNYGLTSFYLTFCCMLQMWNKIGLVNICMVMMTEVAKLHSLSPPYVGLSGHCSRFPMHSGCKNTDNY